MAVKKLVLFDIDHTLISNGGAGKKAIDQALRETLKLSSHNLDSSNIRLSGKTDVQIINEFLVACRLLPNAALVEKVLQCYLELLPSYIDEASKAGKCIMHEGVPEILQLLEKSENIALGLLTGNVEKGAQIKLKPFNLNRYFPIGAFGSDSANRLDLPAIAHKRAQAHYKLNWLPQDIVIIGDAENDVLCAKHYGAISLAVNTGTTTWEELSQHQPHYIFPSLKNTEDILAAIMSFSSVNIKT